MLLLNLLSHVVFASTVVSASLIFPGLTVSRKQLLRRGEELDLTGQYEAVQKLRAKYPEAMRQPDGRHKKTRKAANACFEYRMWRVIYLREQVMNSLLSTRV